ncbi:MAG: cyanophycin synthetase [Longimicrobiales bacterium]|nr:cyanophycin synthetase [Longimicrobiales bacterium]
MKILEERALRGPNRYSRHVAIFLLIDIGELEERPSDEIPGFADRLVDLLPSLYSHRCSVGEPGGFIQRLHRGTWAAHIVEHVAIELQCLAGMEVGFGKTLGTAREGVYKVAYRYRVESAGMMAGREAVALVEAMIESRPFDLDAVVDRLKALREADRLGPSTGSIVEEAKRRGIPALRLNDESFVQLGYGARQRRIQATMTDRTSALGVEIADEKFRTKRLLAQAGIPVAEGVMVEDLEAALRAADEIGYPVAVKPEVGNHGTGITARVSDPGELEIAVASALRIHSEVIVEKTLVGFDFRVLVIDGTFVAAALREPAHVVGDGTASIRELIDRVNADPNRGIGHERVLTVITVDEMTERLLRVGGHEMDDVLPAGERLHLKTTANLSTGGSARDVTDEVHSDVRLMCERIARLVGLDCVGIDIMAETLSETLRPGSAGVVEVNAAPGFRMHLNPTEGRGRDVAGAFVGMMFPPGVDFDVPVVAVTGTNGKTTTTKLIAHTLRYTGHGVGLACTTGVEVDGTEILSGDYAGPEGARAVLSEPTIDHAVLEVSRGGIIRRGLGFAECRAAILLNVDEDHIGMDGVDDLDELALVKSTVIEVVQDTGTSVLNADDPTVVGLRDRAGGEVIYFSLHDDNPVVLDHIAGGGVAVVVRGGDVVILSADTPAHVMAVDDAPITLHGAAEFNTANVLAAVAALHGLGLPVARIRGGISTFHPTPGQNPGRMNLIDFVSFRVLVDYGHNVPAVRALGRSLPRLTKGRKIVVAHGTGTRLDENVKELGAALAAVYDYIVVADADPRGRGTGETARLVWQGARDAGCPDERIEIVLDPLEAIDRAFALVEPGDLIVVQVDEVEPMLRRVMAHHERRVTADTPEPDTP